MLLRFSIVNVCPEAWQLSLNLSSILCDSAFKHNIILYKKNNNQYWMQNVIIFNQM